MKRVAFICIHNSCRSQMAEAFGRVLGLGVFEPVSAGTERRERINQDAVRIMKEIGIDMELLQKPKLIEAIMELAIDVTVTMGCGVSCPVPLSEAVEDWGLEDPSGKSDEEFRKVRDTIKEKVEDLIRRLKAGAVR